ncbi:MAG: hypothetical protein QOH73_1223 [Gaiellaceae bacterium]|jgi:hypothetical protein|nr:hypothetical protein [Gaiellaceae bacterium]
MHLRISAPLLDTVFVEPPRKPRRREDALCGTHVSCRNMSRGQTP